MRVREGVDLRGEGMLREVGGEKLQGGVRGVASGCLEKGKRVGERAPGDGGDEERVDDVASLRR